MPPPRGQHGCVSACVSLSTSPHLPMPILQEDILLTVFRMKAETDRHTTKITLITLKF